MTAVIPAGRTVALRSVLVAAVAAGTSAVFWGWAAVGAGLVTGLVWAACEVAHAGRVVDREERRIRGDR